MLCVDINFSVFIHTLVSELGKYEVEIDRHFQESW